MVLRVTLFIFLALVLTAGIHAQAPSNKDFYLIDNLPVSDLSEQDKELLDSCLSVYHSSSDNLIKIQSLSHICDNLIHSYWTKYQTYQFDFIKKEMERTDEEEKRKLTPYLIDAITNLGLVEISKGHYDQALDLYRESLNISEASKDSIGQARSYAGLGLTYMDMGELNEALEYFNTASGIYTALNNEPGLVDIAFNMAEVNRWLGNNEKAQAGYEKCLSLYLNNNNPNGVVLCYNSIALIEVNQGNIEEAIKLYAKNIEFLKENGSEENMAMSNNNIGDLFLEMKEYQSALRYYEEALRIARKLEYPSKEALYLNNIARSYGKQNDYDKAIPYYLESYEIEKSIDNKIGVARSLNNLGQAYMAKKDTAKAERYSKESVNLYESLNHSEGIARSSIHYAKILYHTGDSVLAYQYAKRGFELCQKMGHISELKNAARILYLIYKSQNDHKLALHMYEIYVEARDSVINLENKTLLIRKQTELENQERLAKYEMRSMAKDIELRDQKSKTKDQKYLTVLLILILISLVLLVLWWRSSYKLKFKWQQEHILKSQMKPHFIFNVLVSIQSLIVQKRDQDAIYYLSEVATYMRVLMNRISEKSIAVSSEIEHTEKYIVLEKLRFKDRLNYKIECSLSDEEKQQKVPPLILQPLVENAIVHGISNIDFEGEVVIRCEKREDHICMLILDNGIGMKEKPEENSKALSILRKRLKLANSKNTLQIDNRSDGQGVKVELKLY